MHELALMMRPFALQSLAGSFTVRSAAAVLISLWAPALSGFALAQDSKPPTATTPVLQQGVQSRYSRVLDASDGRELVLQLSSRTFKPSKPDQPIVRLVGVVHIGDDAYYQALQKHLDTNDLVLFEGVKPAGTHGNLENADDAAKAKVTSSRQRLLAILLERHRKKHGAYPATLEELTGALLGASARLASAATFDAWGHPQRYVTKGTPIESYDLVSLGADGAEGGTQGNEDLKFSTQKPLSKKEKSSSGEGIQVQLAEALGLKFQLASMDYTKPNWRNSDMSIDQVQQRLEESGASGDALFSLLDGSSLAGKFVSIMLGFVKSSPQMAMTMKIMLIETLSNADEAIAAQASGGENMAKVMKVIVHDRNDEVFKDLAKVIETEDKVKTVAVFYGAGHLPDMEQRLEAMGYTFDHDEWFDAMTLDLSKQPGAAAQAKSMRASMRKMLEQRRKTDDND